jgi:hypothetical protein
MMKSRGVKIEVKGIISNDKIIVSSIKEIAEFNYFS